MFLSKVQQSYTTLTVSRVSAEKKLYFLEVKMNLTDIREKTLSDRCK